MNVVSSLIIATLVVIGAAWFFDEPRFYYVANDLHETRPAAYRLPSDYNLNGREIPCEAMVARYRENVAPNARCDPVPLPIHWLNLAKRYVANR